MQRETHLPEAAEALATIARRGLADHTGEGAGQLRAWQPPFQFRIVRRDQLVAQDSQRVDQYPRLTRGGGSFAQLGRCIGREGRVDLARLKVQDATRVDHQQFGPHAPHLLLAEPGRRPKQGRDQSWRKLALPLPRLLEEIVDGGAHGV